MVKYFGWALAAVFIPVMVVTTVAAKKLTPLEKAMRALCEKEEPAGRVASHSNTGAASAMPALPASGGGEKGNTLAAQTAVGGKDFRFPTDTVARNGITITAKNIQPSGGQPDPMGLTVTASAEEIKLSWSNTATAWTGFAGYLVFKTEHGGKADRINAFPLAGNSYRDLTVTPQVQYTYQVSAIDAKGTTLLSSRPLICSLAPSLPPRVPRDFEVVSEEEQVTLKWKPNVRTSHAIAGYLVYRSGTLEDQGECLTNTPVAGTQYKYNDERGEYEQKYFYRVAAVDAWGLTGEASAPLAGLARSRSRDGLILMSTAYRGMGRDDRGFTGSLQFCYYIGTLYGTQDPSLSPLALFLDPLSLWLLSADAKYTLLTEQQAPLSLAVGSKGAIQLFAGQQDSSGGSFTFSEKSNMEYLWGGYLSLSRSFGNWGVHGGYIQGTMGDAVYYLSKYLEPEKTRNLFFMGVDFPIVRRMNVALEIICPLDAELESRQQPLLINLHVDRFFNFDMSFLHWKQGWAVLGYFNVRVTVFPGK